MDFSRNSGQMSETNFNVTDNVDNVTQNVTIHRPDVSETNFTMMVIQSIIAFEGITGNLTVIIVLVNHRKFRKRFQIFS